MKEAFTDTMAALGMFICIGAVILWAIVVLVNTLDTNHEIRKLRDELRKHLKGSEEEDDE